MILWFYFTQPWGFCAVVQWYYDRGDRSDSIFETIIWCHGRRWSPADEHLMSCVVQLCSLLQLWSSVELLMVLSSYEAAKDPFWSSKEYFKPFLTLEDGEDGDVLVPLIWAFGDTRYFPYCTFQYSTVGSSQWWWSCWHCWYNSWDKADRWSPMRTRRSFSV